MVSWGFDNINDKMAKVSITDQKLDQDKKLDRIVKKYKSFSKYQPSGAGALAHRLQHLDTRLIQNGQQGLEKG